MTEHVLNVLFVCTGDSTRGVLAESILNHLGKGRFRAFSAENHPSGKVNSFARELLEGQHFPTSDLRSKSLDEVSKPGAPALDFVFTVGEDTVDEACPVWPGKPMIAHWGIDDPAPLNGVNEANRYAILAAFRLLRRRIGLFIALPIDKLDALPLQRQLSDIGQVR